MGPSNPASPIFCGLARITANDESVAPLADYPVGMFLVAAATALVPSPYEDPDVATFIADRAAEGLTVEWVGVGIRFGVDFAGLPYAVTEVVPTPTFTSITPDTITEGVHSHVFTVSGAGFAVVAAAGFPGLGAAAVVAPVSDTEFTVTMNTNWGVGVWALDLYGDDDATLLTVPDVLTVTAP